MRFLHHIEMKVRNGKQRIEYLKSVFGFNSFVETNDKRWVLRNGDAVFIVSELPTATKHPDSVTDAAFSTPDVKKCVERVIRNGGRVIDEPRVISDDFGTVEIAKIKSIVGNVEHTVVNKSGYRGLFMPGFHPSNKESHLMTSKKRLVDTIDHLTFVCEAGKGGAVAQWYEKCFEMKRLQTNK
jgi:4-hydroxyphenylpyruvate dioxygenase